MAPTGQKSLGIRSIADTVDTTGGTKQQNTITQSRKLEVLGSPDTGGVQFNSPTNNIVNTGGGG